jgi:hypothetical protein
MRRREKNRPVRIYFQALGILIEGANHTVAETIAEFRLSIAIWMLKAPDSRPREILV